MVQAHATIPSTYVERYDDTPIEGSDVVEFRLIYAGPLPASGGAGGNTRPEAKHAIRRAFHPQLRQLWRSEHNLDEWARRNITSEAIQELIKEDRWNSMTNADIAREGIRCMSEQWERAGYKLVPLVIKEMFLRCSIDILFLRSEEPRHIMRSGDLDGKVKTIFDGLRIPDNLAEAGGVGPQEDETPFFCLLSDDKLISSVSVTTDRLLVLPQEREVHPNDAFVVVHVKLKPTPGKWQFSYLFE